MSDVAQQTSDSSQTGDPFAWWRRALELKAAGNAISLADGVVNVPQAGYYRTRESAQNRDVLVPICFWWEAKMLFCVKNGKDVGEQVACELWPFAAQNPVTQEEYENVVEGGKWTDDTKVVPPASGDDPFKWWREALAGNAAPIARKTPAQGFYRAPDINSKILVPVAYWWEDKTLCCLWNKAELDAETAVGRWPFASKGPITEEEYLKVEAGGHWSDVDPAVAAADASPGHNNPPAETAVVAVPWDDVLAGLRRKIDAALVEAKPTVDAAAANLKSRIEKAIAGVAAYKKVTDDTMLASAQTLRSYLLELKRDAVKTHKTLKQPHIDEGRRIDNTWNGLAETADDGAKSISGPMATWVKVKFDRAAEAKRVADEAAAEERRVTEQAAATVAAEREIEARQAEAHADRAIQDGVPPSMQEPPPREETAPAPTPAPAPVVVAPVAPAPIKGAAGRAASIQMVKKGTITDQDKVYAYFRTQPEVIEVLQTLVNRSVRNGFTDVPGVTISEEPAIR